MLKHPHTKITIRNMEICEYYFEKKSCFKVKMDLKYYFT